MTDSNAPQTDARAAGIILFRRTKSACEFLLLRNAKHRSWGFPKGHAEGGESALETARRETLEETGIDEFSLVESFRETITYSVSTPQGRRQKTVEYFLGSTTAEAERSSEHDRMEWLPAEKVRALLGHDNLRRVFDAAVTRALER